MNIPALPLRPSARARFVAALTFAACFVALAPAARAVEIQVEILIDSLAQPPAPLSNACTLRKAVNNANDNLATYPQCQGGDHGNDTIVFNLPGTVTFTLAGISEDGGETGDLDITDSLTIVGHPDGTVIDAADLDRIFDINPGNLPGIVVTLRNIHITNGTGLGAAGAIQIRNATVNLENCTISNSFANQGDGGAIYLDNGGTLNIVNSTITGNNTSPGFTNLTGGIRNGGTANLRNTIVAGNNPGGDLPNIDGTFNSLGYNIVGEFGTTPGNPTMAPATGDQLDIADASVQLGPLASNGSKSAAKFSTPSSASAAESCSAS